MPDAATTGILTATMKQLLVGLIQEPRPVIDQPLNVQNSRTAFQKQY
jgi:hypothetical protein